MRAFPSEEALVAAYWRRLARSIDRAGAGKRRNSSWLKSQARSGVRQRFAASGNVEPAIPTGRARSSHKNRPGNSRLQQRMRKEETYARRS
jgi:hypothetical protein